MANKKKEIKKEEIEEVGYSQEDVLDYLEEGKETIELVLKKGSSRPMTVELKAGFYNIQNLLMNQDVGPLEKKLREHLIEKKYTQKIFENRKEFILKELEIDEEALNKERSKNLTMERMVKEFVIDGRAKDVLLQGTKNTRVTPYLTELYFVLVGLISQVQNPTNESFLLES